MPMAAAVPGQWHLGAAAGHSLRGANALGIFWTGGISVLGLFAASGACSASHADAEDAGEPPRAAESLSCMPHPVSLGLLLSE